MKLTDRHSTNPGPEQSSFSSVSTVKPPEDAGIQAKSYFENFFKNRISTTVLLYHYTVLYSSVFKLIKMPLQ